MKKLLFLLFLGLPILSFSQTDTTKYDKREHLLKTAGYIGYGGWDICIKYKVNSKGESVSDTTYYLFCNSAKYTTLTETFIMYSCSTKKEMKDFFINLDNKLKNMPKDASLTEGDYSYNKSKWLTVTNNKTGRSDSYTYYAESVSKKAHKALDALK
jgi:hypothetical protein